jgi:lysyl-tRNA synthetase class 2
VIDCKPPFDRITVQQAFQRYADVDDVSALAARDENRYFELLVSLVEPALASAKKPIFLSDYPLSQAALARPCPASPGYAERFELYLAGVELCNGYGELTDADEQRARFQADNTKRRQRGQRELPIDEKFLAALQAGLPPCSGNALGFDRLLMLALGLDRIDRTMAFPVAEL